MASPEFPEEKKWKHLLISILADTYDIVESLAKVGSLPEGRTDEPPSLYEAQNFMDYVERVLENESFWASLPQEIPTRTGGSVNKDELKKELVEVIEKSK